ncbi:MAG: LysR family transcriptional regulator [Ruminococcus sp.]|nr:LysR family transcriptional regulator [Ruminococcus sp.]
MKYFQPVVRCKSFTEDTEECYVSQSVISQQIQSFKQALV